VMGEYGIDISPQRTHHLDEYLADHFDWVITLCDRVREVCPEFPGHPQAIHWSIADPGAATGTDAETYPTFQRTAAELDTRIRYFLPQLAATADIRQSRMHTADSHSGR
jgi:protein-tyrosine-phosphatase